MGAMVIDPTRARGPAASGRRCHEQRDLTASLHQPQDHQESFGGHLPETRRHQPHARPRARGGDGPGHHRVTAPCRGPAFGPLSLWKWEWAEPTISVGLQRSTRAIVRGSLSERGEYSNESVVPERVLRGRW